MAIVLNVFMPISKLNLNHVISVFVPGPNWVARHQSQWLDALKTIPVQGREGKKHKKKQTHIPQRNISYITIIYNFSIVFA